MQADSGQNVESADNNCAEDRLDPDVRDAEDVRQINILIEDDGVVIPSLSGPEPNPTGASNERADEDQHEPRQKPEAEHAERELALLDCVVAVAERV